MNGKPLLNWLLFLLLSLIWGSSFILMKIGMDNGFNPYQVASLRIVSAGLLLLPVCFRQFRNIPLQKLPYVVASGSLGSLFPAFLFCIAETKIDSSLAGTLNALTPVFVLLNAAVFFGIRTPANKVAGILVAFSGSLLLLFTKGHFGVKGHFLYVLPVLAATFCYGFNVNMVSKHLGNIPALHIAAVSLVLNAIPAMAVLAFTGFFQLPFSGAAMWKALGASFLLGAGGTALATILFYLLMKRAGNIFASLVTYGIPFVATGWGLVFGEKVTGKQIICLLIILSGVFMVNYAPSKDRQTAGNSGKA